MKTFVISQLDVLPPPLSLLVLTMGEGREGVERQIEACPERRRRVKDRAIDSLVYELYGLSAEEIKIVEGT